MQSSSDAELIRDYVEHRSEAAFAEIVCRHTDLVYCAACRQVESPDLARDVTQSVFIDLARKATALATGLNTNTSLAGWLYRATRFAAMNTRRSEYRRQSRERQAMEQFSSSSETAADWERLRPVLDEAMLELDDADREAVLLRFFKNQDFRAIGVALGVSDDAAQKRVARAIERLRGFVGKHGVAVGAGGMVVAISANAVQAAPAGLAASVSTAAALVGISAATATGTGASPMTATITKAITMTTLQKTIIGATLAVAVGAGIYETHQNSKLREENESLQQQVAEMKGETEHLARLAAATATRPTPDQLQADEQNRELMQLREEAESLRRQNAELGKQLADADNPKPQNQALAAESQVTVPLPAEYPKTADGAAQMIFQTWGRGDWEGFYTNVDLEGGREFWDQAINDQVKSNLLDMEIVEIGEPTNSFAPNMWFVPYTVKFQDGSSKSSRLHVAQDPRTGRWILKGGF